MCVGGEGFKVSVALYFCGHSRCDNQVTGSIVWPRAQIVTRGVSCYRDIDFKQPVFVLLRQSFVIVTPNH